MVGSYTEKQNQKKFPSAALRYRHLKFFLRTIFLKQFRPKKHDQKVSVYRFGSAYGGWEFADRDYLYDSTVISAGLGLDASFDVEFCSNYRATVFLLDPTPQSLSHFEEIRQNFGRERSCGYLEGFVQPVESYELTRVFNSNFQLIPKAIWDKTGLVEFFSPSNPNHVSFSITNLQKTSESIMVPAISYPDLLQFINKSADEIKLLKLDVEGAATEVLLSILSNGFRPKQILVELEEIFVYSFNNFKRLKRISKALLEAEYELVSTDYVANFIYEFIGDEE
jgi:FkbM family methyltransferase